MSFRGMKALVPILIYMIIGFGLASAASFYKWSGSLEVGESVHVEGLTLTVDKNNATGELALIIRAPDKLLGLLKASESGEFEGLSISFKEFNGYGIIDISSGTPFSVSFTTSEDYQKQIEELKQENTALRAENEELKKEVQSLTAENKKLKQQVSELQSKLENQPNTAELRTQITNLTKENRELKAQLANLTNKVNQLKAENEFLSQQNEEYRTMIQNLLKETAQGSEQDYIEQAKKERLIGSVLLKSILFAGAIVGLIGYGLYKKKRGWEYPL
ncbi:hypothetical protein E3E35_07895 [Thermococcus sp. GR7]|uniref:DUF2046 domain-containing protein n=1 Tax=unclassified Thermococcus TaxID=2627626 RepID=UPI00169ABD1D|nr:MULTISPECIES: DUF2046 domain-containing protein [unclassified Thermococcus]NJE47320.1 hypothetical protein [Thermococcus sp. GR7]NJE78685.1 hypothetical protein [Thermococcus sp. GR4]NJF23190.1 hypothetical protein [Thermococcus sp. GR5]